MIVKMLLRALLLAGLCLFQTSANSARKYHPTHPVHMKRHHPQARSKHLKPHKLIYSPYQHGKVKGSYWQWAKRGDQQPWGAIVSGYRRGKPIHVCRIKLNKKTYTGRLTSAKACRVTVNGQVMNMDRYLVLMK